MKDELFRQEVRSALDAAFAPHEPTETQKENLCRQITGGIPMKRKAKISLGLALALLLALLAAGALAAALLSAQEVIEKNAVPMARENDTDARRTESYTHDQLVALVKAANENGITLDETTGIMRALRTGEGYWEDEAIMEICREAFGGLIEEWTYEERLWYARLMAGVDGYEEADMDEPGDGDLPAQTARTIADEAVRKAYPGAKDLTDPACYKRLEDFSRVTENGKTGSVWSFTYKPLDLTHAKYAVQVNEKGEASELEEIPQDWSRFTVNDLEWGVSESYRARTRTKSSWSQEAWHAYRELLPRAERDGAWRPEHDAYLACGYPLPDEGDMTAQAARDIALRDAGLTAADLGECQQILLADETGRHLWKITLYVPENGRRLTGNSDVSWEIDAKTGEVVAKAFWQPGDRIWRGWVLDAVYQKAVEGLLTGGEALALAADALRRELGDDAIPYADAGMFLADVSYNEFNRRWRVTFRTKTLAYATGSVLIQEPEHQVVSVTAAPSQVDGDTLWDRYKQVYGASRWTQDIWAQFGKDMAQYQPKEWIGRLLKQTEYPEESSVPMTRRQAVDIAFAHNDLQEEEELDATLIAAAPHPVWKVVLSGRECIWLYEIDTETGEVLDREKYAPDNYEFDHPVKRYTLHRAFAPVYVETFGPERLAVIEISKAFGDMSFDDPVATVLGVDMDTESLSGEIAEYTAQVDGHTVTLRAEQIGIPVYRVTFTDGWLTEKTEKWTEE